MKYNIFLDDVRTPDEFFGYENEEWIVVTSHQKFIDYVMKNGIPSKISLDHDLHPSHYDINWNNLYPNGRDNPTQFPSGMETLVWILNNLPKPIEVRIHSMNPVGKKYMQKILNYDRNFNR